MRCIAPAIHLDRVVAIKVLPAELSQNADRRQRFEREAKTISSLNHPHICTLHDIGHQEGLDFLVLEYLRKVVSESVHTKPAEQALNIR